MTDPLLPDTALPFTILVGAPASTPIRLDDIEAVEAGEAALMGGGAMVTQEAADRNLEALWEARTLVWVPTAAAGTAQEQDAGRAERAATTATGATETDPERETATARAVGANLAEMALSAAAGAREGALALAGTKPHRYYICFAWAIV